LRGAIDAASVGSDAQSRPGLTGSQIESCTIVAALQKIWPLSDRTSRATYPIESMVRRENTRERACTRSPCMHGMNGIRNLAYQVAPRHDTYRIATCPVRNRAG
jgi:hypothetical protein